MKRIFWGGILLLSAIGAPGPWTAHAGEAVRVGYFPNLTHAQAVIGRVDGTFDRALGPDAEIEWTVFNAGPSVIEALFAGKLDLAYVGPNPAINGYVKSQGDALRVIAGAASGGAGLVVRSDAGLAAPEDFRGKKVATPQLGNTQDVALRGWLSKNGLAPREKGGDVQVFPVPNGDHVTLFIKKEIEASWTVEPWLSILEDKAGGKLFLDEASLWPDGTYATTVVIVRRQFLAEHPELVRKFIRAHAELTARVNAKPDEAKRALSVEIEKLTHKAMPVSILDRAFGRVRFTTEGFEASLTRQAEAAFEAGFLKEKPDLRGLHDLSLLKEVSAESGVS